MGVALGAELLKARHSVRFLGRFGPVAVNSDVLFPPASNLVLGESISVNTPSWDRSFRPDAVFFCVKAYQLASALMNASGLIAGNPTLVVLCNGVVDEVLREFSRQSERSQSACIRLGGGTVGVTQDLNTEVVVSGGLKSKYVVRSLAGRWVWGPFMNPNPKSQTESDFAESFPWESELFSGSRFSWTQDPLRVVREKWLVNSTINTITAAYKMATNGEILKAPEIFDQVFKEAVQLGREMWGEWAESDEVLKEKLMKLIHDTAGNENSMARDVRMKRPTESSWLAGLAVGRTGYPILVSLHQKIENQ